MKLILIAGCDIIVKYMSCYTRYENSPTAYNHFGFLG